MTDRPILFSAPMMQQLLAGHKTQTRRHLKNPEYYGCPTGDCPHSYQAECNAAMAALVIDATKYAVSDRLWVREAWSTHAVFDGIKPRDLKRWSGIYTYADNKWHNFGDIVDQPHGRMRPSMFMPRWASRLTLTVTDVRIERLQDISEADAIAEGMIWQDPDQSDFEYAKEERLDPTTGIWIAPGTRQGYGRRRDAPQWGPTAACAYRFTWDAINGAGAWSANPWIVVISFSVEKMNIDKVKNND